MFQTELATAAMTNAICGHICQSEHQIHLRQPQAKSDERRGEVHQNAAGPHSAGEWQRKRNWRWKNDTAQTYALPVELQSLPPTGTFVYYSALVLSKFMGGPPGERRQFKDSFALSARISDSPQANEH